MSLRAIWVRLTIYLVDANSWSGNKGKVMELNIRAPLIEVDITSTKSSFEVVAPNKG